MKKRWSILLLVVACLALALQFVPRFVWHGSVRSLLFGVALVCLYGLCEKPEVKKYYHIVFVIWGMALLRSVLLEIGWVKVLADADWIHGKGWFVSVYRFLTMGWMELVLMGVLAVMAVTFVFIILREQPKMNWMLLACVLQVALVFVLGYMLTHLIEGIAFFSSDAFYWIINTIVESLWTVGAIMVAITGLKRLGAEQRKAA